MFWHRKNNNLRAEARNDQIEAMHRDGMPIDFDDPLTQAAIARTTRVEDLPMVDQESLGNLLDILAEDCNVDRPED